MRQKGPRHLFQTKAEGRWSDRRICTGEQEVRKITEVMSWRKDEAG